MFPAGGKPQVMAPRDTREVARETCVFYFGFQIGQGDALRKKY